MKTNDQEGTIMLSKRRYDNIANWDAIVEASENGGDAMEKLLCDFTMSLDDVCNTFITLANQAGGTDNITTVAVETATKTAGKAAE